MVKFELVQGWTMKPKENNLEHVAVGSRRRGAIFNHCTCSADEYRSSRIPLADPRKSTGYFTELNSFTGLGWSYFEP